MAELSDGSSGATSPVLLDDAGPIARIILDRPRARNVLSHATLSALSAALDACAARPDVRVVVLAANGPAFSAGHDLREIERASPAELEELFALCARTMLRLQDVPQPVIARVHGIATAAGCQLVAACDLAVAATSASFATPGINIGFFCSTPAVPVARAIGRKRALEMLFTGTAIDAETACRWGLVNRVVPDAELDAAIDALAERIVASSGDTIALGKRAFYDQIGKDERAAYELASAVMCENALTPDAREGITAFIEKRRPVWRPR